MTPKSLEITPNAKNRCSKSGVLDHFWVIFGSKNGPIFDPPPEKKGSKHHTIKANWPKNLSKRVKIWVQKVVKNGSFSGAPFSEP